MNEVAIIGAGQSVFSRKCGMPITELCFEAFREAMGSCTLRKDQIDASICCSSLYDKQRTPENPISDYLGLAPRPTFLVENACAASTTGVRTAWSFIKSGLYKVAVVVGVDKMSGLNSREVAEMMGRSYDITWESSFGMTMAAGYAMHAQAYLKTHRATQEQLARVRVKNSFYGTQNPKATFRKSLSLEEIMASQPVASPLKMLDCCGNADGASCIILAKADIAADLCEKPIRIMGVGAASDTAISRRQTFSHLMCARRAAEEAYAMAGIGPKDVDVAEVHDCFTIAEIMAYEDLGFAEPGEGVALIDKKETYLSGRIPVNLDGGLLSKGHPVGATGGSQITTIVRQLRGEAGPVQVKDAKIGLVHNVGGIGHFANVTILGG